MLEFQVKLTIDARVGTQDHTTVCLGVLMMSNSYHEYIITPHNRSAPIYYPEHLHDMIDHHIKSFPQDHPLAGIPKEAIQWRIYGAQWTIERTVGAQCITDFSIQGTAPSHDTAWSSIPDLAPLVQAIQDSLTPHTIGRYARVFRNPIIHPFLDGLSCNSRIFSADTHPSIYTPNHAAPWTHGMVNISPTAIIPSDLYGGHAPPTSIDVLELNVRILDYAMVAIIYDDAITYLAVIDPQDGHAVVFVPYTTPMDHATIHQAIADAEARHTQHRAMDWQRSQAHTPDIQAVLDRASALEQAIDAWTQ